MTFIRFLSFAMLAALLSTLTARAQQQTEGRMPPSPLRRCINLGNMLEAPTEGAWGVRVQKEYLKIIAEAGFDTVRIPTRWNAYAATQPPYTIGPRFFERMDEVIGWALDAGLRPVVNIHHYDEVFADPAAEHDRLLAIWRQIAEHYQDYPDALVFEVLNEPHGRLDYRIWNDYQNELVNIIRESNPERLIVVGGDQWNSERGLPDLRLPDKRDNLIVTFHYYDPFQFTHQGAEWVEGTNAWLGMTWGQLIDYRGVERAFNRVARWGAEQGVPIFLGEFGAYSKADMESRVLWTAAVREQAEKHEMGWCYWEFAAGFGIYNPATGALNELYPALIPPEEAEA